MAVAITGADMITSVGADRQTSWQAFCAGTSGNRPIQVFDQTRYHYTHAYEITDRAPGEPDVPGRASHWLSRCVASAIRQAEILPESRVTVLVGSGLRELRSLELWWTEGLPLDVAELHFGGAIQERTGLTAPVFTISNACSASSFALGLGADLLTLGEADAVIVAGTDAITESMLGLLDRVTPVPPQQVQPFDRDRRNVMLGEGAAAVVLELEERSRSRGVAPLARLRGVGMSCDAYHETAPLLEGVVRAMRDAHTRSGVTPAEIDLIMAHGTGTPLNDQTESLAIKTVFGEHAGRIPITGLKSMTGHTSGASGLIGVVTAIAAMHGELIPPTMHFASPLPEGEGLDFVSGSARPARVRIAQVNAFGFGGINAVAILERVGA